MKNVFYLLVSIGIFTIGVRADAAVNNLLDPNQDIKKGVDSFDDEDSDEFDTHEDDQESELRLSGSEVRDNFQYGVMVGVGRYSPYQTVGIDGSMFLSNDLAVTLGIGSGQTETELRERRTYALKYSAQAMSTSIRYFVMDDLPIYVNFGAVLGGLKGKLQTAGLEDATSMRDFNFKSTVFSLFSGVGFQGIWANGLSVDYSVIGINKALWYKKTDLADDDAKTTIHTYLKKAEAYGLINIRIGYFF